MPLQGPSRDTAALILPLSIIKSKNNIRHEETDVDELAESISANGLLMPLLVRKDNGAFTLIAGHRRYQALLKIGATEAAVRIQNVNEDEAQVLRLIENIQRQDLAGAEEVVAVAKLLPLFAGNQSALGRAIGRSPAYVSRCVRAAELIPKDLCDVAKFSKSILFELADSVDPKHALERLSKEQKPTVQAARQAEGRKPSGAIPGGRYIQGAIQFRENQKTHAFFLRVNFDPERTPPATKEELVRKLQEILNRLRNK